jgi:hypothetical protein
MLDTLADAHQGRERDVPIDPVTHKEIKYENELEYYHHCKVCGQLVDRRYLDEVVYHMAPDHKPTEGT